MFSFPTEHLKSLTQPSKQTICLEMSDLDVHVKEEPNHEQFFICQFCCLNLFNEQDLEQHLKDLHPEQAVNEVNVKLEPEEHEEQGKNKDSFHSDPLNLPLEQDLQEGVFAEPAEGQVKSEPNLEEHEEQGKRRNTTCSVCGREFKSARFLTKHKLRVHGKRYTCPHCPDRKFADKFNFDRHMKGVHPDNKPKDIFTCGRCSQKFIHKSKLEKHMSLVHELHEKVLRCEQCSYTCSALKYLTRHIKGVHEQKTKKDLTDHACSHCEKVFRDGYNLARHIKTVHEQIREFSCEICQKEFAASKNLQYHILNAHTELHVQEKLFHCQDCSSSFASQGKLNEHMKNVHTERQFQCSMCDKKFATSTNLKRHILSVHEKQKPFECSQCSSKFTEKASLNSHIATQHEHYYAFPCSQCNMKFTKDNLLKKHVQVVHEGQRPYNCPKCDQKFKCNSSLKYHLKNCSSPTNVESMFPCVICHQEFFSDLSSLENHMKTCST